ncbi:hypothetical protein [Streptomyces canus]|uniref:hypothetical protein n=1 Tax=Streptomyces canus TaxID=58343 RepID=UPI0036E7B20A
MTELKDRVLVDSYENTRPVEEDAFRKEINERWIELSLFGPPSVSAADGILVREHARLVVDAMATARERESDLLGLPEDYTPEVLQDAEDAAGQAVDHVQAAARLLARAIDAFALTASDALNDDGTRRRRKPRFSSASIRFLHRHSLGRE